MAIQRSFARKIMMSLYDKEASYDAGPGAWTSGSACQMSNYAKSAVVQWDDTIISDAGNITGTEFPTHQELVLQSVRLPYEEPQARPNTLAGLMALALGTVSTTQDSSFTAYR